ncbi:diamine acetyltransferase 1-like [Diadema antillarum]|uniref:diamine acetyltransferase 1-like n=1 Tax=Diadema antillarum TaxID=105358 RepID=UPI003A884685
MESSYLIRRGQADDAAALYSLIKEMSEYEKLSAGSLQMTIDGVREHILSADSPATCLVIENENSSKDVADLAGFAVYNTIVQAYTGKSTYLNSLFVAAKHRRKGLASALLNTMAKDSRKSGCSAMTWRVYAWNSETIRVYEKLGAHNVTKDEELEIYALESEKLQVLAERELKSREDVKIDIQTQQDSDS